MIARGRYLAYQLNVLMRYLDNLLAWGDSLFRQDTMESLNEATQVYVLAANLLGPRPQKIPERHKRVAKSFKQLDEAGIDAFGNALVELENELFEVKKLLGEGHPSIKALGKTLLKSIYKTRLYLTSGAATANKL